ncbi:MAG: lamin tail domain-containing protein [Bacteroidales bacterium]
MKYVYIAVFVFLFQNSAAQLTIDFEDHNPEDFNQYPENRWMITDQTPLAGEYSLRHYYDNSESSRDRIAFPFNKDLTNCRITWQFLVKYDYNPSGSNNWGLFLISDQNAKEMHPSGTANGYLVGVNYSGSDDMIKLWKISSGAGYQIINTQYNWEDNIEPGTTIGIEVEKDENGWWTIKIDENGGFSNLTKIGDGENIDYNQSEFIGLYYEYTSSADSKLWFDELSVDTQLIDTTKPVLKDYKVVSENNLHLVFSEPIDSVTLFETGNYILNNTEKPSKTESLNDNYSSIGLIYESPFTDSVENKLEIREVTDRNGNPIRDTSISFLFQKPEKNDVIINEIMADPYPSAGLPEKEYIELLNPNEKPINLEGWELSVNYRTNIFQNYILHPGEYVILCSDEGAMELSDYGDTYSFSSFPALNNSEASISIIDSSGKTINAVSYSDKWYKDEEKENGGFSLEKIDPLNNCSGSLNWTASEASQGGTPGNINSVNAPNIDTIAPKPVYFSCISPNQIKIIFNESIAPEIFDSPDKFFIPSAGHPFSILKSSSDAKSIELLFNQSFAQDSSYQLQVNDIYDLCANDTSFKMDFTYHEVQPYDILVNEVMAKPDPSKGLPEEEYIEIFNRSDFDISIDGWSITTGSRTKKLGQHIIPAKSYLILCDTEHEELFEEYGTTLGINKFPVINNTEAPIYLETQKDMIIDYALLKSSWHENDYKEGGGWSLELIDPNNPCGEKTNWSSSESYNGGTPGEVNSVNNNNPDNQPLFIRTISVLDEYTIKIHFNEAYGRKNATDKSIYSVRDIGEPVFAEPVAPDYKTVVLTFEKPFKKRVRYTLEIENKITDCAGNINDTNLTGKFEIPEKPKGNDIVINELLYDPWPGGEDFIELYNRSEKTFEIADLCVANEDEKIYCLFNHNYLLFPGEYLILTKSKELIATYYYTPQKKNFVEAKEISNFNSTSGSVYLYDKALNAIDYFHYDNEMHFPLLNSTKGISLERIHFDRKTNNSENWHSAASSAGYATPGYKNSQFTDKESKDKRFTVSPEVFSPDNDGKDDILSIHYQLKKPGYVATIRIFDDKGRVTRNLVNNKTLSTEGELIWDGLNKNSQMAKMGIYLIYIELFDLDGNVEAIKKHCVLGRKF